MLSVLRERVTDSSEALIRMMIEAFLIRNLYHAKKHEKEKRESCGFFCKEFPSSFCLRHHLTTGSAGQKAKLKLGKGKKQPTNAVDTTFKARCPSFNMLAILCVRTR